MVDKKIMPPSGDKRDYLSLAPYFWPDPSKGDGTPSIRKDEKVNPESRDNSSDNIHMSRVMSAIATLAEAYEKSRDEVFAEKAAGFLKIWFLDYTRLNLSFLFDLAKAGESRGIDLWSYQSKDGRSIRKALDFMIPYLLAHSRVEKLQKSETLSDFSPWQQAGVFIGSPTHLQERTS
ncbi:MAG: alginate lyase family protein [Akkermansiaceae bacterium]